MTNSSQFCIRCYCIAYSIRSFDAIFAITIIFEWLFFFFFFSELAELAASALCSSLHAFFSKCLLLVSPVLRTEKGKPKIQ